MDKVLWISAKRIGNVIYAEGTSVSSLDKPLTIKEMGGVNEWPLANGSIIIESDTGKVFFYNEAGAAWVEQFSFQS